MVENHAGNTLSVSGLTEMGNAKILSKNPFGGFGDEDRGTVQGGGPPPLEAHGQNEGDFAPSGEDSGRGRVGSSGTHRRRDDREVEVEMLGLTRDARRQRAREHYDRIREKEKKTALKLPPLSAHSYKRLVDNGYADPPKTLPQPGTFMAVDDDGLLVEIGSDNTTSERDQNIKSGWGKWFSRKPTKKLTPIGIAL